MTKLGRNLKLDPTTWDLALEGGNLVLTEDVAQSTRVRLRKIRGEWFRNTKAGVPWLGDNEAKLKSAAVLVSDIRETILATIGVGSLTRFDVRIDSAERRLHVAWTANTDAGETSGVDTF